MFQFVERWQESLLVRPCVPVHCKAPGPVPMGHMPPAFLQQMHQSQSQSSSSMQHTQVPMQQQLQMPIPMHPPWPVPTSMQQQGPMHIPAPIQRHPPSVQTVQALGSPHLQFEYPGQIVINGDIFVPASLLVDALRCQPFRQQLLPQPFAESCPAPVPRVADAVPKPPEVPPEIVTRKAEELARSWVRSMPLSFVPKAAQKRKQEEYDRQREKTVAPKKRPIKRAESSKVDKEPVRVDEEDDECDDEDWGKTWKQTWDEPESEASTDNEAGGKKVKWFKSNQCNTKGCVFSCSLLNSNLIVLCYQCKPIVIH